MAPGWWPQRAARLHLACSVVVVPSESPLCVYLFRLERDLIGSIDLFQKGHADQAKNEPHSDQDAASAFPNMLWLWGWGWQELWVGTESLHRRHESNMHSKHTRGELHYRGTTITALIARLNRKRGKTETIIYSSVCSLIHSFLLHLFLKYLLGISYVLDSEITGIWPAFFLPFWTL